MFNNILFGQVPFEEVVKILFVLLLIVVFCAIWEFIIHRSCFIARKTGKPVCACWDCKNPCDLSKFKK